MLFKDMKEVPTSGVGGYPMIFLVKKGKYDERCICSDCMQLAIDSKGQGIDRMFVNPDDDIEGHVLYNNADCDSCWETIEGAYGDGMSDEEYLEAWEDALDD